MIGKPSTKKTSQTIIWAGGGRKRRPKIQASEAYLAAVRYQLPCAVEQFQAMGLQPLGSKEQLLWVRAQYLFKDGRNEPDLDNLNTSLADLLAHKDACIIANDRYIKSWDGSRKHMHTGIEATIVEILPFQEEPVNPSLLEEVSKWN